MPDHKDKRMKISIVEEKTDDFTPEIEQKEENHNDEVRHYEPVVEETHEEHHTEHPKENVEEEIQKPVVDEPKEEHHSLPVLVKNDTPSIPPVGNGDIDLDEKETVPFWILFLAFLMGLAVGAGIVGGVFFYRSKMGTSGPTPTPAPTMKPVETTSPDVSPSPSASPVANSTLKVEILNGTGVKGAAAAVETIIKKEGFEKVTTGNAANFNFTKTQIQAKSTVPTAVVDSIQKALEEKYEVEVKDASKTQTSDIVITVGKTTK